MATKTSHGAKQTTNHDTIRRWAEERGGKPATVRSTERKGSPGILRIDFPGGAGDEALEEISWDSFFEKFDAADLAMIYQEEKADGEQSYFCKFVSKESAED